MSDERAAPQEQPRRVEEFDTARPIDMDIGNSIGSIEVELTDTALTHVEVEHDPRSAGPDWRDGVAGLLHWVSNRVAETGMPTGTRGAPGFADALGYLGADPDALSASAAVHSTRIDLTANQLVVRAPESTPLHRAPLAIRVRAPRDSHVGVRTQSGAVTVSGPAGRVDIHSGAGGVSVEHANGRAAVRSGSGPLRLGSMRAEAHAHSGSGDIEITSIGGASTVETSTGDVRLGEVNGDVLVRTGSGGVTVADAVAGHTELISGSGELRVSIRRGVAAEVDLTSSTGSAISDLTVADQPPEQEPPLKIFGRTGSGNAWLSSAV